MLPNTQNGQTVLLLLNPLIIPVLIIYASDIFILTKAQANFGVRRERVYIRLGSLSGAFGKQEAFDMPIILPTSEHFCGRIQTNYKLQYSSALVETMKT